MVRTTWPSAISIGTAIPILRKDFTLDSLQVQEARTVGADAILLMLADLPLITTEHLENLVTAWAQAPTSIIASAFEDTLGPPIVFPKTDFDALLELSGDRGARPVIDANRDRVQAIACEEAAFDIDRPEDLAGIY